MVLLETTETEIKIIILNLKSDCALGWDNISTNIIKNTNDLLAPIITHICTLSISSGVFPDVFKKASTKLGTETISINIDQSQS